ncbi:MAG: hypothetical protein WA705_27585 [Candidatus Ozemobacteraceae bacterium]
MPKRSLLRVFAIVVLLFSVFVTGTLAASKETRKQTNVNPETWQTAFEQFCKDKGNPDADLAWFNAAGNETRPSEFSSPLSTEEFANSQKVPQNLNIGNSLQLGAGSAVVYGGSQKPNVFSDAYFVRKLEKIGFVGEPGKTFPVREHLKTLIQQQPWLEWIPGKKTFSYHATGGSTSILSVLSQESPTKITLYRGTTLFEAKIVELLSAFAKQESHANISQKAALALQWMKSDNAEVGDHLKPVAKALRSFLKTITTAKEVAPSSPVYAKWNDLIRRMYVDYAGSSYYQCIFATDNEEKAKWFSAGALLKFSIPTSFLQKKLPLGEIYVGIEDKVEIGFFSLEAVQELGEGFKSFEECSN